MRFERIRLMDFRNLKALEAGFGERAEFICGPNGQGKTNLLEALGFVTSLRSFRTTDPKSLIRWEAVGREAGLYFDIDHEERGATTLEIRLQAGSKKILVDGEPVRRMGEIIGLFPTVTFSSHDIQILRGGPALRRRFMDMVPISSGLEIAECLAQGRCWRGGGPSVRGGSDRGRVGVDLFEGHAVAGIQTPFRDGLHDHFWRGGGPRTCL